MSLIYRSLLSLFSNFLLSSFSLLSSSSLGFWKEGRWLERGHLTFESETPGLKCWIHTILADGPLAHVCWPRRMEGWENAVERGKEGGWCGGDISLAGWQLGGCGRRSPLPPMPRGLSLDLTFGGDLAVPESQLSLLTEEQCCW